MEETAYAKINLALHVRAREADFYHSIETLFAFAEDGDRLRVEDADQLMLVVSGPFARDVGSNESNLVVRAAEALSERFGIRSGAAIMLDKRLPVASGIGGGSADAAAALRLLSRWWGLPATEQDLLDIAATLGADVPACVASRTVRGTGRGDVLSSQDGSVLAGTPLLMVNPGVRVPTAEVCAAWSGEDKGPMPIVSPLATAIEGRNDLETPACRVAPQIAEVLALLDALPGRIVSRMSGSGATCFALFEDAAERDTAAQTVARLHPDWWRLATRLR
jgi:4-diphosphocytidyl-2-C-methyl-D-erythritol kinase